MRHVESVFGMGEGYVLDLNDQTAPLGRKFNPTLFDTLAINDRVGKVLAERMVEAQLCLQAGADLAAVILSGSVLEGLCLGVGQRHTERVVVAAAEELSRMQAAKESQRNG